MMPLLVGGLQRRRRTPTAEIGCAARGIEVGILPFVILRSQDALSWPLAAFVGDGRAAVELDLSRSA
jgi:hypothetical protein